MYTDDMKRAFRSIQAPKKFSVSILDNDHFLVVKANEMEFVRLFDDEKREAVEYMFRVKKALEMNGAVVILVREAVEK